MKKINISLFIIASLIVVAAAYYSCYIYGMAVCKKNISSISANDNIDMSNRVFKLYQDAQNSYEIYYPADLYVEGSGAFRVGFNMRSGDTSTDMALFAVTISTTTFKSTREWLDSLPKGNPTKEGYKEAMWIGDTAVVEQYLSIDVVDDNGKPILGREVSGVQVANGKLYKIVDAPGHTDTETRIDQTLAEAIGSFNTFSPPTGTPIE